MASRSPTTDHSLAFSLNPSGNWDGNDGGWSTFAISVGTPAQVFRVLPSINGLETWIPMADNCSRSMGWCGNARGVEPFNGGFSKPYTGSPNPSNTSTIDAGTTCTWNRSPMCKNCVSIDGNCTNGPCTDRNCCGDSPANCNSQGCSGLSGICTGSYIGCPCIGVDYNAAPGTQSNPGAFSALVASGFTTNQSSTWSQRGNYPLFTENLANDQTHGQYGLDLVLLGVDASVGLTLKQTVVVGIPTNPFYLGNLGLKPSDTTSLNDSTPTLMKQLRLQGSIPSLSYGYTAGALYRKSLGSLTLGGCDSSRFLRNDMSFPLGGNDSGNGSQSLMVVIRSISASETLENNVILLSTSLPALVDSTLPFLWLPVSVCQVFEQAFGLTWDASKELYLVNDTVHHQLLSKKPSVVITLGNHASEHESVNITLPYGAFDLQASSPIFPDGTNYFPLRRASSVQQYALGRVFLQEAYLVVDYEQSKTFSISQAQPLGNNNSNIVTIDHCIRTATTNTSVSSGQPSHHLNPVAITGAVVGPSVAIIILCTLAVMIFRAFRRRPAPVYDHTSTSSASPMEEEGNWPSSNSNSSNVPNQHTLEAIVSEASKDLHNAQMIGELEDGLPPRVPRPVVPPWAKSRQELAGCNVSNELPQTPMQSRPRTPTGRVKHIYELAADEHWIARHKA